MHQTCIKHVKEATAEALGIVLGVLTYALVAGLMLGVAVYRVLVWWLTLLGIVSVIAFLIRELKCQPKK